MPSTINVLRTTKRGTEPGLTGSEAVSVENVGIPDQVISAGVEEQIALGGFPAERLQTLALRMSQAGVCQFLGPRYAIDLVAAGAPGVITSVLDLTALLFAGDFVRVEGSDTPANDGIFEVAVVAAGPNNITMTDGCVLVADAAPAGGTIAKIMSAQVYNLEYEIATTVLPATITYAGNLSDIFAAGDILRIANTAVIPNNNDGLWEVLTVTTDGPPVTVTTITLGILGGASAMVASAVNVGDFQKFRPAIALAANVPFQWSIESGLNNPLQDAVNLTDFPLQGRVDWALVNNAGAANANFGGRIGTNAVL